MYFSDRTNYTIENKSKIFGESGEKIARQYLIAQGHTILETNWRFKKYEVDIISQVNNTLVFTEVKARSSLAFGEPELFVTPQKQQFLIAAAHHYITERDLDLEARFDIIAILQLNNTETVKHLESAFYPVLR